MTSKLLAENCSARLVVPAVESGYVPAKIIVDTKRSDWNLDMRIQPKYQPVILGTYIVNRQGKQLRAKGCLAYQGIWRDQPLIIVKTLGVGKVRHLLFVKCEVDGRLVNEGH